MICQCESRVICLVAALVGSKQTDSCLRSRWVPMTAINNVGTANRLDLDPLSPGCGCCVSNICWCAIGEEDDNEKKWEVLRTISLVSCQNGIGRSQHVPDTQDESCRVRLQVADVSHHPARCNNLVRCCFFVNRD